MSSIVKIQRNFQVTIPVEIREKAHIEVGDLVDFEISKEGILIKPQETIDRSQAWFWSNEWQAEEKKAEDDFRKGKALESKDIETFLEELGKK